MNDFLQQPHLLVIDDDPRLRELLASYLREQQFLVSTAANAADARALLPLFQFDAAVCDVMMPKEDGLSLTRFIRSQGTLPVLLLTAMGDAPDRIAGLEAGADDYLPKPFEPRELLLRLQAILRRVAKLRREAPRLRFGRWQFAASLGLLEDGAHTQKLTTAESNLLRILTENLGQPLTREQLADLSKSRGDVRAIDVQITRLRRKLETDPKTPRYLQTVRGEGYVLYADAE